ncbi:MAG TPA: DNA glycosylase, partial [Candidatus Nitrosotalea sp.]|nr:DNA glycosylase [Candidatus Nitrosotalea sp.]
MQRAEINLDYTINSGQVFLWDKAGSTWYGIDGPELVVVREPFEIVSDKKHAARFFRSDDNLPKILAEIGRDRLVGRAARQFKGLRLARQDPFQCYVSFICSSNS